MRSLVSLPLLTLAACSGGADQPAKPTPGQQARARVDAATKAFGACVFEAARTMPANTAVGPLAQRAIEACPDQRAALKREVVEFTKLGREGIDPRRADLLAEASVKQLESGLREQAAIALLNRSDVTPKG